MFWISGWALGEHQEWSKFSNYEVAVQVPLILYIPGLTSVKSSGHRNAIFKHKPLIPVLSDSIPRIHKRPSYYISGKWKSSSKTDLGQYLMTEELVEMVDIFPTLVELAGYQSLKLCPKNSSLVPLCTEGASLVPLIKESIRRNKYRGANLYDPKKTTLKWKSAIFTQYPRPSLMPQNDSDKPLLKHIKIMGYSMRTDDDYHYTEWIQFDPKTFQGNWSQVYARELYIHTNDPREDFNVADDPSYYGIVKKLSKKLQKGWRSCLPKKTTRVRDRDQSET